MWLFISLKISDKAAEKVFLTLSSNMWDLDFKPNRKN